jgi:hypothetical protein
MEVLELSPLGSGAEIAAYLDIKFKRLGKERAAVIDGSGCEALAARLRKQTRTEVVYSIAYPLLINNEGFVLPQLLAVYDVLATRIRALRSKGQGRQNVGGVNYGNEAKRNDLDEQNPEPL